MKSGVWNHFKPGPGKKATCDECGRAIARPNSGTSDMLKHLEELHPLRYEDAIQSKEAARERARNCAMVLAENPCVTASLFRSRSFLKLFSVTEPRLFPSRNTLMDSVVPEMVEEIKQGNKEKLRGVPVTLVTDGWSSKGNRVSLTCVIAYYLTEDWKLESSLLAVKRTDGAHTGEVIAELLKGVIDEFELDVVSIMSDAAANVRKAAKILGYHNPRCSAHGIHLVVRGGLSKWKGKTSLKNIKDFSELLSRSGPVRDTFFSKCGALNLKKVTIPNSVETRWNSDYFMLRAALKQANAINPTLAAHHKPEISSEDFATIEKMELMLGPIAAHMGTLTKEGVVLSETMLVWNSVKKTLTKFAAKETGPTKVLAENILKEMTSRWAKYFCDSDILIHSFFDPSVVRKFDGEVNWKTVGAQLPVDKLPQPENTHRKAPSRAMSSRRASMYQDSDEEEEIDAVSTSSAALQKEIDLYLQKCKENFALDLEALDYWRIHSKMFPNLAVLARRYLTAPPTSVSAERIFSCAGISCFLPAISITVAGLLYRNHLRNRLGAEKCEEYLLMRVNSLPNLRSVSVAEDRVYVPETEKVKEMNEEYQKEDDEEERDTVPDQEENDEQDPIPNDSPVIPESGNKLLG